MKDHETTDTDFSEHIIEFLRGVFKDTPKITDKTPTERTDKIADKKFVWENGIDVRISIRNLKIIQDLLK